MLLECFSATAGTRMSSQVLCLEETLRSGAGRAVEFDGVAVCLEKNSDSRLGNVFDWVGGAGSGVWLT